MSKRNTRPVIKNDPATYRTRSTLVPNSSTRMADEGGRIMVAFGFDSRPVACSHDYLQLSDRIRLDEPYFVKTAPRLELHGHCISKPVLTATLGGLLQTSSALDSAYPSGEDHGLAG